MDNVDNEWEQFLLQFNEFSSVSASASSTFSGDVVVDNKEEEKIGEYVRNECEALYISTQTKIFYLNVDFLDVTKIYWNLPIMEYSVSIISLADINKIKNF
jgi:hypothetical protein